MKAFDDLYCPHDVRQDGSDGECWQCQVLPCGHGAGLADDNGQCSECEAASAPPLPGAPPGAPPDIPGQLSTVRALYRRWFGEAYDTGALDAVLAAAAAERLTGDPPWLLVVGGSGATKTETVAPLAGAGALVVSTISGEAALLSGTSQKEKAADAHGGLLRQIGAEGILVVKDVTTILSMNRDSRAEVLAALREVYDGLWSRQVGTDGGRTLTWSGRIVVVGAVTTAWDAAHAVISTMGDRFVLVRMRSKDNRRTAGASALDGVSHETEMRRQLADAVSALLANVDTGVDVTLDEATKTAIVDVADLVTLARTAVERSYNGEVLWAHDPEMPTRFAKQLAQLVRGGRALGMAEDEALAVALRCAGDTMPALRLRVLVDLIGKTRSLTRDVVKRLQLPRNTVDRTLQELHLLGLLVVEDQEYGNQGRVRWAYTLAKDVSLDALGKLSRNVGGVPGGTQADAET